MDILATSEDPDEIKWNVAFYQGLPCLRRQKLNYLQRKKYNII